uniref:Uncharacterized protein n=1 Tax=Arundo donax TaxID=35708 RepID=A0A0A9B3G6_ARUDO
MPESTSPGGQAAAE